LLKPPELQKDADRHCVAEVVDHDDERLAIVEPPGLVRTLRANGEVSARTLAFSARRTLCCSVIVAQTGGSSSSSGLS
jgi:hypothetical protein